MTKAIGHHYTSLTARMVTDGNLRPNMIRCSDRSQALDAAKRDAADGKTDAYESHFGCLTVFDDGSVELEEFTMSDMEF
jgi:hypothetical protein